VSGRALRVVGAQDTERRVDEPGWLEWLRARLDPAWRGGEWDGMTLLFTGDLDSARTAAWPCRTPDCPTATRRPSGRCDGCRRARVSTGLRWADFDSAPPARATRPLQRGVCSVPGCEGDLHCAGLCFRHERAWSKDRTEPVAVFIARARPLARAAECRVPGCDRERITRRGLCRFHDQRLHRRGVLAGDELAAWVAAERPRLGMHQFSLAGLPELPGVELLYALQHRDQAPPPLDPTEVRILLARLGDAASLREADPQLVCESGGMVYNATSRGLFRDVRRHLDRAWAQYTGTDPLDGDVWQVALLDLRINASRRWPATQGIIDFRGIEPVWLRVHRDRANIAGRTLLEDVTADALGDHPTGQFKRIEPGSGSTDAVDLSRCDRSRELVVELGSKVVIPGDALDEGTRDVKELLLSVRVPVEMHPPAEILLGRHRDDEPVVQKEVSDEGARFQMVSHGVAAPQTARHETSVGLDRAPVQARAVLCTRQANDARIGEQDTRGERTSDGGPATRALCGASPSRRRRRRGRSGPASPHRVGVRLDQQGLGIGSQLLDAAPDHARATGCDRVTCWTR